ncbi:hypothetical protein DPMN_096562 [Dreissena polymorpha]|uniref:Uncharacterized protein n=1 Tax=Dreissena polymorpha TaxID=45954 RepID=A0A9D4R4K7_DREPO|nr:hypothetical protein DPMN_096562 [Dreissena polymorpha]
MRIQTCPNYTSGRYQAIPAEETFFCQDFHTCCLCKKKIHQQSTMLAGSSSQTGVFEGKLIPSIPLLDALRIFS